MERKNSHSVLLLVVPSPLVGEGARRADEGCFLRHLNVKKDNKQLRKIKSDAPLKYRHEENTE